MYKVDSNNGKNFELFPNLSIIRFWLSVTYIWLQDKKRIL